MNSGIIFITGGARSGKSSFALKEASRIDGKKAYIATAEALDEEMKARIEEHKRTRGNEWDTYEEPLNIAPLVKEIHEKYDVILIDCLTLWLSNLLIRTQSTEFSSQIIEDNIKEFIDVLKDFSVCSLASEFCSLYVVSNEVGMGIVPDNEMARRFRDMAGLLNESIAEVSDEVYLVVAGIPIKIKNAK